MVGEIRLLGRQRGVFVCGEALYGALCPRGDEKNFAVTKNGHPETYYHHLSQNPVQKQLKKSQETPCAFYSRYNLIKSVKVISFKL